MLAWERLADSPFAPIRTCGHTLFCAKSLQQMDAVGGQHSFRHLHSMIQQFAILDVEALPRTPPKRMSLAPNTRR